VKLHGEYATILFMNMFLAKESFNCILFSTRFMHSQESRLLKSKVIIDVPNIYLREADNLDELFVQFVQAEA
jgi:hypothetical protein